MYLALVQKPELYFTTCQCSFKPTIEEAVLHIGLKIERLQPEISGSKRTSARRYRDRPSLPNPSYSGRTWTFTLENHLFRHHLWKHKNEEEACRICLVPAELFISNPFPSALPCAGEILATMCWRGDSSPPLLPACRQACAAPGRSAPQDLDSPSISSWPLGIMWSYTPPWQFHQSFAKAAIEKLLFVLNGRQNCLSVMSIC